MSLRLKLLFMLSTFLVLIIIFAAGTLMIFDKMSLHMSTLSSESEENRLILELGRNVTNLLQVTNNWGYTGYVRFKKRYQSRVSDVQESFEEVSKLMKGRKELEAIDEDFRQMVSYSRKVIANKSPQGDPSVADDLREMNLRGKSISDNIDRLHQASVVKVMNVARESNDMKRHMIFYLIVLITFSSLMAVFLIISIRRAITVPFNELLKATERISSGELSYRIRMNRRDEFGIVSDRFDNMVVELEQTNMKIKQKLTETELFLDIARIAGTTLDLKDALDLIVETVESRLKYDLCTIFMLKPDKKAFCYYFDENEGNEQELFCLPVEEGIAKMILSTLSPVSIEDTETYRGVDENLRKKFRSILAVPVMRENTCSGILIVGNNLPYSFTEDEANTLKILAHTISSVVRNAELFQSTRKQLQKLTVLYELSKAVTSVLNLDELLKKISEEISRMLSAKGCIIRLIENGRLRIRSHYGELDEFAKEIELDIGSGIAGWVAEKGSAMLVEDMSKIPLEMKSPTLEAKSVICVPLKVDENVIGTIGLYDKYDRNGNLIPFTVEDLNTVEGFASISEIAIEKSKMYENELIREKKISEARKRLDILFNSVQGGLITLDQNFKITSVNKFIEDWINKTGDELIGHDSIELFHDKIGICPHCAAKATFETGGINSIMQSKGVNYAELTAYPIKNEAGEVIECVVFIMDITERVLYQEETLSLYREVIQAKEYIESIIGNSADAIVATNLDGIITSWNPGAEKIFGFKESEAMGKFLPFVPEFILDKEKENIQMIRNGEVLKDIETLRKKKDGSIIEVSLALSPIKDAAGEIIGISGISRDISEKKRVEKELIRRNQELSRLFFISSAMRGTLELNKLLRMVLTAVTMSDGMGFNRAILFLVDEGKNTLKGMMGVGPANPEEAWKIWDDLAVGQKTLDAVMQDIMESPLKKDSFLDRLTIGIELSLDEETVLTKAVKEKRSVNVLDVKQEPLSDAILIQQLGTQAYAVVPLLSRDKVIGLIWVDNYFTRKIVTEEDMKFLSSFSNHIASAIESARLFEQMTMAEQQLENIFESISDMVYFNSKDYEIKNINKAVSRKLGLPASEIIGRKCYEVFHGMNEPNKKCPHHKTVMTGKAYIEELDDPHLGGTFLTSSSPIFDSAGEYIGSVHVVRDITELKNLREKLTMAEKMAALGEVAAKVAHEIRNPLVSVGGFAKRLEKKLDGNLKEYAEIITKEVERLEDILKEILGFVKEVRLAKEIVNLNDLVESVITLMKSNIEERGIVLEKHFSSLENIFIDPNRVKEAVMNILSNAVQAIVGSGSIYIRTYETESFAVLEIQDTGKGISEIELPYIFDPFFTTKNSGTGLGLAITRRIIQEHNGTINVTSEVDKGTTFKVYIPKEEKNEDLDS